MQTCKVATVFTGPISRVVENRRPIDFPHPSQKHLPAEGHRGTGVPRRPSGEARDLALRRYGRSVFICFGAMVLKHFQIVN
jgi:hypothetical protein